MHKTFIKIGALAAAVAIGLGAFGAHALKDLVSNKAVETFETAARYMFYHAIASILVGILFISFRSGFLLWAGRLFIAGIILFSGSLIWITKFQASVTPVPKWLGPITPIGGLCFILGWIFIFIACFRRKQA